MDTSRAWAEIDLDALDHNLRVVRRSIGPLVSILLVVKADAYGHGAVAIAQNAVRAGVEGLGVSTCREALQLREAGIRARIVVLGAVWGEEALPALAADVEIGVPSRELCAMVEDAARRLGRPARVHVKVDTGMHRLGSTPDEALALLHNVRSSPHLELSGLMTHVAATDGAQAPSAIAQQKTFEVLLARAQTRGLLGGEDVWVHVANTSCVLSGWAPLYDAVRLGIGAYGVAPDPRVCLGELRPVMSVRTRVVQLKDLRGGAHVGYGGTWTAPRPTRIAVLSIGYDDGVDWRLGNRGSVLVAGRRAPVVGRISMDYTTVDVSDVPGVVLGQPVTVLGSDGDGRIGAEDLAALAGTVPYDVLCSIGKRVGRVYVGGERPRLRPLDATAVR